MEFRHNKTLHPDIKCTT